MIAVSRGIELLISFMDRGKEIIRFVSFEASFPQREWSSLHEEGAIQDCFVNRHWKIQPQWDSERYSGFPSGNSFSNPPFFCAGRITEHILLIKGLEYVA